MVIVYPIVLLIIVILALLSHKNLYNPTVIFAGLWLFIGALSFLNLYGFNDVSDETYFLVVIGVLCFTAGSLVRSKIRIKVARIQGINIGSYNDIKYDFLIPFFAAILLFTILLASRSIVLLMHGVHMETIRFNYSSIEAGLIVRSGLQYNIEHYIVATAEFAGVALLPIVVMDKKTVKRNILFIMILLFLILHMFVTGARSFIFDIVFAFLVYYLIDSSLKNRFSDFFNRIPKAVARGVIFVSVVLFIAITSLRRGGPDTLLHEIYSYFTMCFRLLETHISIMRNHPDYTYGMTFFHGLLRPVFLVLKFVGIPYPAFYQKAVDAINANNLFYAVGRGSGNSFVTVFYYFFMDFGYFGVLLGCFLYGYFSKSVYYAMQRHPDKRSQSIYLLLSIGLFLSFTRFHFSAPRYIYAFVLLLMSFRESGKTEKDTVWQIRAD